MRMKSNQGLLEIYPYHDVENAIAVALDSEDKSETYVISVNMLMKFVRNLCFYEGEANE